MSTDIFQLLGSTRSPYTRKARIAAAVVEAGDQVRLVETVASQFKTSFDPALAEANPLLQIPVLIDVAGEATPDSSVICALLDQTFAPGRLLPHEPAERLACLRREAFADNLLAKLLRRAEELRKAPEARSASWMEANRATIVRALDWLERTVDTTAPDVGVIATAVALDYLDFRLTEFTWRDGRSRLADWRARVDQHPAFAAIPFSE